MMHLDMRTVVVLAAISYLVCTLFVIQLWWENRNRFDGLNLLAINFVFQTVMLCLIASRGIAPDWISITFANILSMVGSLLNLVGLERFLRKPGPQLHNYLLLAAGRFVFYLFDSDLPTRTLIFSIFS